MKELYLTIDDSPSIYTDALVNFLDAHQIQGIFYVRGAFAEDNPAPITRAIEHGHVIGNHLYHHQRASLMPPEEVIKEIEQTEKLIETLYKKAGVARTHKLLRFPHMDRGTGAHVVDYEAYPDHRKLLENLFLDSLNVEPKALDRAMIEKKAALQNYLSSQGYTQPFKGIMHDFYNQTEMAQAHDSMFTYSTGDWMLTKRHLGKWPYKLTEDLISKMDQVHYLKDENSADILLIHDDRENILEVTKDLLRYWTDKGANFLKI